jgi:acyl-CoA synthetase (AMP-forming)/AMP-acid ligase II
MWTQGLHRAAQQRPDGIATVFGERRRTFREQAERVARLASGLRGLGVRDGTMVGVLALNSDHFADLLPAIPWAGGVLNPFSVRWGINEIRYALEDSGTTILCVDDTFAPLVAELGDRVGTVVHLGDGPPPDGMIAVPGTTAVEDARRGGADLAALMYTGGTTGVPKGVLLSHETLAGAALATEVAEPTGRADSRTLIASPMSHVSGMLASLLQTMFAGTQVIVPSFTPGTVLDAVEQHRVSHLFLVPSMLRQVLDEADGRDLSSVRHLMYGAAPITEELLDRVRARLPHVALQQVYASTEMALCTVLNSADHAEKSLLRSAGRAVVNREIRIVGPDGAALPPGDIGEVTARGTVMLGYRNRPAETAHALRDGWLHTGDAGYLDENGYLFLVDRIKDMIVTGGDNVYSTEVENALAGHPAVAAVAVIAVPDDDLGERVHAVVVLRPGCVTDLADLRSHCATLIAPYKWPRSCEFAERLPLSPSGKPLKRELRAAHWPSGDRQIH